MPERGTFHTRARAAQLISFVGLQYGTTTPTDLDMFMDFRGRGFVFGELKHNDAPMHRGQELALERLADACERGGVPTLVLVASHSVDIGDVPAADAIVRKYRWRGKWEPVKKHITVKQACDIFHARCIKRAA